MGYVCIPTDLSDSGNDRYIESRPTIAPISEPELNERYCSLFAQLPLEDKHRNRLKRERGLSDEAIAAYGFKSFAPRKRVEASRFTPGVEESADGYRLAGLGGIALPIRSVSGNLTGYQIATEGSNRKRSGKYVYPRDCNALAGGGQLVNTALPIFTKSEVTAPSARVNIRSSGGSSVSFISLIADDGAIIAAYMVENPLHPYLAAIEIALKVGIGCLRLPSIPATGSLIRRVIESALDAQGDYFFDEYDSVVLDHNHTALDGVVPNIVYLCDGILKSYIAAYRHNIVCVGAVGGAFASYSGRFERELNAAYEGVRFVVLAPDGGDVLNHHVAIANRKTLELIESSGRSALVSWWGQKTKADDDIDEIPGDTKIEIISIEQFKALHSDELISKVYGALSDDSGHLINKPGIYKVSALPNFPHQAIPEAPTLFPEGGRIEAIRSVIEGGFNAALDSSWMGTGKSHTINAIQRSDFERRFDKILWVANDPISEEWGWQGYRARDAGRYRTPTGRITRSNNSRNTVVSESNCQRFDDYDRLLKANLTPTYNDICNTCPFNESCANTPGQFLHDRAITMAQDRIRIAPQAIHPGLLSDKRVLALVDDCEPFIIQRTISRKILIDTIRRNDPLRDNFPQLKEYLLRLFNLSMEATKSKRALHFDEIINRLGILDTSFTSFSQLMAYDYIDIQQSVNSNLPTIPFWVPDFLEAINDGYIHFEKGNFTFFKRNRAFIEFCNRENVAVIFFDGTAKLDYIKRWLGHDRIAHIQQEPTEGADLEINQYIGFGACGYTRSPKQIKRLEKLLSGREDIPRIDIKASEIKSDLMEVWRGGSRGSNVFAEQFELDLVGAPRKNLVAMYAEFKLLFGRSVSVEDVELAIYPLSDKNGCKRISVTKESTDKEFARFYYNDTITAIRQAIERLRASRRRGDRLRCNFISDFPLPFPVNVIEGTVKIRRSAVEESEFSLERVRAVIALFKRQGTVVTCNGVAAHLGLAPHQFRYRLRCLNLDWKSVKNS
ncbi:hypothetical protein [Roseofilum capinflatum]|uniref:Uncharacterized protein n=1 Tax=Roseofilum capinflatum BLCC-M114 TaxID=3022440 RepID=A0ABT7B7W7_9CYAN|nr:hypothetical protein [Roseofilum capinflatum]MDJ1174709.1 hypothetical protein [Roseofilum capinflatum BLCC-M114]